MIGVMRRELRRMASRPLYALLMVVLPVAGCLVLTAAFRQGVPRDLPVAVCNADNSPLSRQLVRMIDATPSMRVVPVASPGGGEALVRRGEVYAVISIPSGLERDVRRGEAPHVLALYNAQALLPASLVRRDLKTTVGTLSAGIEIRGREARGESPRAALAHLEPIALDVRTLFNVPLDYSAFLMTALLPTLLQIFIVVTVVHAVGVELKDGSAGEWLQAAGGRTWRALAGKLFPYAVHFSALGLAMLAFMFGAVHTPLRGHFPAVVTATILLVLAYVGVGLLMAVATANLRFATSLAAFYVAPAFAFVGITFPVGSMPGPARIWSALLPLTHYLDLLVGQTIRGASLHQARGPVAVLLAFAVAAPLLAWPRAARVLRDGKYWGRR